MFLWCLSQCKDGLKLVKTLISINVARAQRIGDREVTSINLVIGEEIPPQDSLEEATQFYKSEAKSIMHALASLPQGTKYELLCQMLESAPVMYRGK